MSGSTESPRLPRGTRIREVRTVLLTGPYSADPWFLRQRRRRDAAFVEIETTTGVIGVGETYLGYFFPESVAPVVDYLKEILLDARSGDVTELVGWMRTCGAYWGRVGLGAAAISGIEAALWDLVGKLEARSVVDLLGGPVHERLLSYASSGASVWPPEALLEKVRSYLDRGYRAVKIATGYYPLGDEAAPAPTASSQIAELEARKLESLRQEVGETVDLLLDGHMGHREGADRWTPGTALEVFRAVEPYHPWFFEEPLPYTDLEGYASLSGRTAVRVAGGEQLTTAEEFTPFLEASAFSLVQPDASWLGVAAFRAVAEQAARRGLGVAPHAAGAGGSIMQNLHLAFASEAVQIHELPTVPGPLHEEIWGESFRWERGWLLPPAGPGFGVRLDDSVKRHFPFTPGAEEFSTVPGKVFSDL